MKTYPVNPISIIIFIIIIGIIVLFVNASLRKKKAKSFLKDYPNASLLIFEKQIIGNNDYADNIYIKSINGNRINWFFYKPNIPAVYVKPGLNKIVLHAQYSRKVGNTIKKYTYPLQTLSLDVSSAKKYTLEFSIIDNKYILEEISE